MKLLLTSSGISNKYIAEALHDLVKKPANEAKVGFIPIAANAEDGNKDWVVNQILQLWRYGYNWIDIIDPTAKGVDWQERLSHVDIVYLTGGNTFHLLDEVRKTGFDKWLLKNLKRKVYVGGSASTILLTPSIAIASVEPGDPNLPNLKDFTGLGLVDYEISPHVPNAVSYEATEKYAAGIKNVLYALDDDMAIKVVGQKHEPVGNGVWKVYNET